MMPQDVMGIDSYVGKYLDEKAVLFFDYGEHSHELNNEGQPGYIVRSVEVDGKDARLVRYSVDPLPQDYRSRRHFVGLHVPVVVPARRQGQFQLGDTALTMSVLCGKKADCDAMEAVLLSVVFP